MVQLEFVVNGTTKLLYPNSEMSIEIHRSKIGTGGFSNICGCVRIVKYVPLSRVCLIFLTYISMKNGNADLVALLHVTQREMGTNFTKYYSHKQVFNSKYLVHALKK